ncbi:hypothetical protein TcWFU_004074 [Taenia crassiceps]|uniref:Uncharacterized protein n=1 Tax=Taenia crassiceps TaxID=6207 RepID=A0ABR4Q746_9CEST
MLRKPHHVHQEQSRIVKASSNPSPRKLYLEEPCIRASFPHFIINRLPADLAMHFPGRGMRRRIDPLAAHTLRAPKRTELHPVLHGAGMPPTKPKRQVRRACCANLWRSG